ncbi:hypothetical protein PIB30_031747 [Stylosanthes scabra]|uniref:Uncharacterized protein n=1 Tax=Stylosanthes scabra TaxID=79078 RepID=A0ABU6VDJ6_9FABA|nr:hypothetical protein [Stylosanthes scabra]
MAENPQGDQGAAEAVQIPRELLLIYRWVTNDVLGSSYILSQQYLDELKLFGVLFGGGDLEWRYRVQAPRRGERKRLLARASVAPSQLHPNTWSSIRCFKLVTRFLELPQDPEAQRLTEDTIDVLIHLFSKNNLAPKSLLSNSEEARRVIVEMAGNDVTLARLCNLLRPPQAGVVP